MRTLRCSLACLLLLTGCGGGSTETSPKSAVDESASSTASKPRATRAQPEPAGEDEAARAPEGPRCDDGTCSRCGSGICPAGWYCSEKDGGVCSWLAECAEKPSCSCITRVLGASCKCDASDGGLKVACD